MLRHEKKNVALIKDPMREFSNPGDLVLDLFAGTLSTASSGLLMYNGRRFWGFEKDIGCLEKSLAGIFEVYVCQLLNDKSDWKSGEKFMEAVYVYLSDLKSRRLKHSLDSWAPHRLLSVQTCQDHVESYLGVLQWDFSVSNQVSLVPYITFTKVCRGRVKSLDVDGMLSQSCGAVGIEVMKSTIEHKEAGMRCSARVQLERE